MKPDHFRDIIATNALYRPGPLEGGLVDEYIEVKHGRKPANYPHPVMKEVLEETNGVMVFQEQVMRIINLLGGIPLADAYSCIKAISKKKLEMIAKFREAFIEGAKGGFETAVRIIPYLVGLLVAISLLRNSGTFEIIIDGMKMRMLSCACQQVLVQVQDLFTVRAMKLGFITHRD